ncbi:PQQ-dependent sugar dehydrogenase [Vibrio scophthalmi]|uniref:PQQ-dependent sugar dehydrogenase n=1 Tax=Vibrio scophthalmi TaxID=45658 RepID=UPI002FEE8E49
MTKLFLTRAFLICTLASLNVTYATAQVSENDWQANLIVSGLNVPWGIAAVDDTTVLISQRNGEIGQVNLYTQRYTAIHQVSDVAVSGQGGLLDVARSPFESDRYYFTFSKRIGDALETALATATIQAGKLSQWRELLVTKSGSDTGRHFGSRITFDDQYLYLSVGDRGERPNGQDRSTHAGSILRLHPDGTAPKDNPFVTEKDAQAEIWSYGHRNPQGLFYDGPSQTLWSIEHGPRGGDEINLIEKGANYGWPITSHGKEYWGPLAVGEAEEAPGVMSPRKVYVPSIAPGSLVLYRGEAFPELDGKLLAGALKLTHINVLTLQNNNIIEETRLLEPLGERIRDIEVLPNGGIVFSTDSGKLFQLTKP